VGTDRSKARRPKTPEPEGAGLVALVDAWLTFAAQVADFTGDFDGYLLALDGRSMCQRAMREATRETSVRLGMSVAVGDGRYRRRTKPDDRGLLLPHTPWDCSEWWWRRVPLRGPALRWLEDGEVRSVVVPGRG